MCWNVQTRVQSYSGFLRNKKDLIGVYVQVDGSYVEYLNLLAHTLTNSGRSEEYRDAITGLLRWVVEEAGGQYPPDGYFASTSAGRFYSYVSDLIVGVAASGLQEIRMEVAIYRQNGVHGARPTETYLNIRSRRSPMSSSGGASHLAAVQRLSPRSTRLTLGTCTRLCRN